MASIGPFAFLHSESPASHAHPLAKLLALLVLSAASASSRSLGLILLATFGTVGLILSGVFSPYFAAGIKGLVHDARFLLPVGILICLLRVIDPFGGSIFRPEEIAPALLYIARLAVIFAFAEAFFRSTSTAELSAAATHVARKTLGRDDLDPGLYLSLAIGFIPRCFSAWAEVSEAAAARGYGARRLLRGRVYGARRRSVRGHQEITAYDANTPRQRHPLKRAVARLKTTAAIVEAFVACSLRGALATAEALEARGYSPARKIAKQPFRIRDAALIAAATLIAGAATAIGRAA